MIQMCLRVIEGYLQIKLMHVIETTPKLLYCEINSRYFILKLNNKFIH